MKTPTTLMLLLCSLALPAAALDLAALWDYGQPALSEQRFLAALEAASPDERLILQTQIARSHGLRGDFERARAVLAAVEPQLGTAAPEARVRYELELGRSHGSARHPTEARTPEALGRARQHFLRACELATAARLDGLAVDALHMLAIVEDDPARQIEWTTRAMAFMENSDQAEARRWEGTLRNNLGYSRQLQGDHEAARAEFRRSRAAYARDGRTRNVRIADGMIARSYRLQQRHAEALAIQLELERAWDAEGRPDPQVWAELELLYRALGEPARAEAYREKRRAAAP